MKLTLHVKRALTALLACGALSAASAISDADAAALLQKTDSSTAFYNTDFTAAYEVVQQKPGEGRKVINATIYRRDKELKWTILINAPLKDKGKGYLKTDSNIWFYDPADRRFTFSSSKDKFQGTNANTSDFAPQNYVRDYTIESTDEVKLGSFDCVLFTLTAKTKNVDYPKIKLWVTKSDGLTRKKEDYSLSGQNLRTTAIPSYQKVDNAGKAYQIPVRMIIQDNLKGKKINGKMDYEKTIIDISNVSLKKQDDAVYTKPYLELMGSK